MKEYAEVLLVRGHSIFDKELLSHILDSHESECDLIVTSLYFRVELNMTNLPSKMLSIFSRN